jgi:hypothetical protein
MKPEKANINGGASRGESSVILGPERIEARVLLAPRDDVAFAQVYTAG